MNLAKARSYQTEPFFWITSPLSIHRHSQLATKFSPTGDDLLYQNRTAYVT